ncbi:hypothetical protein J437_LFUL018289, partial [Ladona fulva]
MSTARKSDEWKVVSIRGDRGVLGQSEGVGGGSPHLQHPTRYSHSRAAISHSSVRPRSAILPTSVEREVERILACPQSASNQIPNAQLLNRKSHSLDSLLGPR